MTGVLNADDISIKGSDTMIILSQRWAEVFMAKYPDIKLQVNGGGSGIGLAALQNNQCNIANASRSIKAKEIAACIKAFGARPTEYKVALDGLSVYVNSANPIEVLSIGELKDIFTGKIVNWKELGGEDHTITVYSRENSSGTYEFFKEHVLNGGDYRSDAQTMPGTAVVIQAVSSDKYGIGYGGAAYAKGIKQLNVSKEKGEKGIAPTEDNVESGKYPIWRYLYVYLNPNADSGNIRKYINWIRSDEGQSVVKDIGYYPLPKNLRSE